jgi:hypothetical protein
MDSNGLTWDGEHLWLIDFWGMIYKLDSNGNVLSSFNLWRDGLGGATWADNRLWISNTMTKQIYEIGETGNIISEHDSPLPDPKGMAWDGRYFWIAEKFGNIHKVELAEYYPFYVSVDPAGGGSVTASPDGKAYRKGTEVTLIAQPENGYIFSHWSGAASGPNPMITVVVDSETNITAHFKREEFPLVWIAGAVMVVVLILIAKKLKKKG